ncbi:hypothetical protein [Tropicimonas isoalkanivorans]|uniref:Repeat domain-containing protein n=1 Tax=Tropicimonas isoalkanivorans TaxID=441112 RepID=A0A1I1JHY8_9RHOB|nr:hypothetical protein [Tropicimonas isoalkanivorans]SFC48249.1 hypothetical protein SAMN04488094_105140 [Tropicimonas isoalkanivorans]
MWRAALCLLALMATEAVADACAPGDGNWVKRACFERHSPTRPSYGHDVLGGTPEWNRLRVVLGPVGQERLGHTDDAVVLAMPAGRIIEDIAPRVVHLDGDGPPEIVLVISDAQHGAQLAVFDLSDGRVVGTPFIGRRHRWLAPVGAADLDGDGWVELAYIDRPHLAKVLRVWRYRDGQLVQVAAADGFTNHRIGEREISGGLRTCDTGPEMVLASADWSRVLAVRLRGGQLIARDLGPAGPGAFQDALTCR